MLNPPCMGCFAVHRGWKTNGGAIVAYFGPVAMESGVRRNLSSASQLVAVHGENAHDRAVSLSGGMEYHIATQTFFSHYASAVHL